MNTAKVHRCACLLYISLPTPKAFGQERARSPMATMARSVVVDPLPLGVFTVYSTQNAEQSELAQRFAAMTLATQPSDGARVLVRSTELHGLQREDGTEDAFRSVQWYRVLVRKVTHWAELAAQHPGRLLLCSDNDVTLLPGWREALLRAYVEAGRPDLCFQREGGDDPFFAAVPYNSGFFLMNGSARAAGMVKSTASALPRCHSLLPCRLTQGFESGPLYALLRSTQPPESQ